MFDILNEEKYKNAANKCLAFINRQMNVNNYLFGANFGQPYAEDYVYKYMWGTADGLPSKARLILPKYIKTDMFYDENYSGQVSGSWYGLDADYPNLSVDVFTIKDTYYHTGSCPLRPDGTWKSERCVKKVEIWVVPDTNEEGTIIVDPATGNPQYDPATVTIKTIYEWEPEIINESASTSLKEFRLVSKNWDGIPMEDTIEIDGPDLPGSIKLSSKRERLKPQGITPSQVFDYPYAQYVDYKARFHSLTDSEYLTLEVPIWDLKPVQLLPDDPQTPITASSSWQYTEDNNDPFTTSPLYIKGHQEYLDVSVFRGAWSYPPSYSDARFDSLVNALVDADYDDTSWLQGVGPFGFNNAPLATTLTENIPNTTDKVATYFFRNNFTLNMPQKISAVEYTMVLSGAAIVYLNGVEIGRHNTPPEGYTQNVAYGVASPINSPQQLTNTFTVPKGLLRRGQNTMAVELHQESATGSNIYFHMPSVVFHKVTLMDVEAPYIKNVVLGIGPDDRSINFTWLSNVQTPGVISVWEDGQTPVSLTADIYEYSGRYKVKTNRAFVKNLQLGKIYNYQITNGDAVYGPYTIKMPSDVNSYSFLIAGDPQITSTTIFNLWKDVMQAVIARWPNVHFFSSVGDQIDSMNLYETQVAQYDAFFAPEEFKHLRLAAITGNHDNEANFKGYYNLPNEDTVRANTASCGPYWYKYGTTLFLALNTNNQMLDEQRAFMEDAIAQYTALYGPPRWKIVVMHHPIYSTSDYSVSNNAAVRRGILAPMFSELGIDVVLAGHDHTYTRTKMMNGTTPINGSYSDSYTKTNSREVVYITLNSASGSKFYIIRQPEAPYVYKTIQNKKPCITKVDVSHSSITIATYEALTGIHVDTFTLNK